MPHRLDSLDGQVALITGGAGGLGSEAALWLAAAGAQVVVADVSAAVARAGRGQARRDARRTRRAFTTPCST